MTRLPKHDGGPSVVHPVSDADYVTLADFRSALRKFLRTSEEIALSLGLTPQQHQALLAIKGFPGGHAADHQPTGGTPARAAQQRRGVGEPSGSPTAGQAQAFTIGSPSSTCRANLAGIGHARQAYPQPPYRAAAHRRRNQPLVGGVDALNLQKRWTRATRMLSGQQPGSGPISLRTSPWVRPAV